MTQQRRTVFHNGKLVFTGLEKSAWNSYEQIKRAYGGKVWVDYAHGKRIGYPGLSKPHVMLGTAKEREMCLTLTSSVKWEDLRGLWK